MARRRQKHLIEPKAFFGLLVVLGAIWLITQLFKNLPSGSGRVFGLVILVVGAAAIAYPVVRLLQRVRTRQALLRVAREASERQLAALVRRRAQLVRLDPYGKPRSEHWAKEIDYFISQHIEPSLTAGERAALGRNHDKVAEIIGARVETATREQPAFQTFSDDMTPVEFEAFCAEQLRLGGWNARVTLQSRDQGVDVIAEKAGRRVVLHRPWFPLAEQSSNPRCCVPIRLPGLSRPTALAQIPAVGAGHPRAGSQRIEGPARG